MPFRQGRRRRGRPSRETSLGGFRFVFVLVLINSLFQLICVFGAGKTLADRDNAHPSGVMVCVYPISGQYGLLPRVLYYVTFAFGLVVQEHQFLVIGALASALTFAGAAAVHGLLLAFLKDEPAFDLDVVACACILNSAWSIAIWLFASARKVEAGLRRVLRLWGVLTSIGSVAAVTATMLTRVPEDVCQTAQGDVLTRPAQYDPALYNCTYKCFAGSNHFRSPDELVAIPLERQFGMSIFALAVLPTFIGTIWFACMHGAYENHKLGTTLRYALTTVPFVATVLCWELLIIGPYSPSRVTREQLPYGEAYDAVGQWGPWVVAGLVLVAAVADWGSSNVQVWTEIPVPVRETGTSRSGNGDEIGDAEQAIPLNSRSEETIGDGQPLAASLATSNNNSSADLGGSRQETH